jgi:glycerophosphoryl diester phosphodiesterase
LGGFIFVSRWNVSRFFILRADGYRILFHSSLAGICLLVITRTTIVLLTNGPSQISDFIQDCTKTWDAVAPFSYSGTAALSLLMGSTLWYPLNWLVLNREFHIDNTLQRRGDSLELVLRTALGQGKLVSLLLRNDELYIGYVISNFNPIFKVNFLKIMPVLVGNCGQGELATFSTSYYDFYKDLRIDLLETVSQLDPTTIVKKGIHSFQDALKVQNLGIVISIEQIRTVKILEPGHYGLHCESINQMPETKIIAHRGGAQNRRNENTSVAFSAVLDQKGNGFECDVALSSDGEPVITHKPFYSSRIVTPSGKKMDLRVAKYEQLKEEGILHLNDVLQFVRDRTDESFECYLEPKVVKAELTEGIVRGIQKYGLTSRAHIITFYSRRAILREAKDLDESIRTSVILLNPLSNWSKLADKARADMVVPGWRQKIFNFFHLVDTLPGIDLKLKVDKAHHDNLLVYAGIADDTKTAKWLCEIGVDGIYTNKVSLVRDAVAQTNGLNEKKQM